MKLDQDGEHSIAENAELFSVSRATVYPRSRTSTLRCRHSLRDPSNTTHADGSIGPQLRPKSHLYSDSVSLGSATASRAQSGAVIGAGATLVAMGKHGTPRGTRGGWRLLRLGGVCCLTRRGTWTRAGCRQDHGSTCSCPGRRRSRGDGPGGDGSVCDRDGARARRVPWLLTLRQPEQS
jgi:hypothetical protein